MVNKTIQIEAGDTVLDTIVVQSDTTGKYPDGAQESIDAKVFELCTKYPQDTITLAVSYKLA